MRAIRLASAAALGLTVLSLTAPAASAVGSKVSPLVGTATPSTIAPGGQVTLSLSGCDGQADASSDVFDVVRIPPGGMATATVDWDAKRGAMYTVTYTCDDNRQTTSQLTIAGARPTPTFTRPRPTVTTTATAGPARGGVGGSQDGMNAGEIAAGAALVVAATGGVIFVLRRRAGSRQH
ncbi:hypothetical protein J7E96_35760 [Streptomyces sp. ISL-96]|uniref:hypothetical protein n=1 Tax=Streptomyces sp. ISL-96 TaxID=2819191 RepID=UPI001BED00AE|nr:hypothetical protein [Streptomyces sp. ISL-96]MBT2493761.1 hypothetical protein [Streptomyces sp. ISL-96]